MIRILNRLLKLTAKGISVALPASIKNRLRQNKKLLAFYSRTLQQRFLFFGCVSRRALNKSYQQIFKQQQLSLNQLPDKQTEVFDLVVLVAIHKVDSLETTLSTAPDDIKVHVVCRKKDIEKVSRLKENYPHRDIKIYPSPIAQLETENSVFVIHAGQCIDPQLGKALFHWSQKHDILYTDKDYIIDGEHQNPIFLPDWNPDFQLSAAYIRSGMWFKHQNDIPTIISNHAQTIAEWAAALYLNNASKQAKRIPYTLVHETEVRKFNYNSYANSLSTLAEHKASIKVNSFIGKLTWQWQHNNPLVSIIIPVSNKSHQLIDCVESLLRTSYKKVEILLVPDASIDDECASSIDKLAVNQKVNVIKFDKPTKLAAKINYAAKRAKGDVLGVIDPNVEAINPKWLHHVISNVSRKDVGCVGTKLFYSDGRVKHAGIVFGQSNSIGYAHNHFPGHHLGYLKRLTVNQSFTAVDGDCLFVKRQDFIDANGFNEQDYRATFVDIDFCLRVASLGKRNMLCANAELYHHMPYSISLFAAKEMRQHILADRETLASLWPDVFKDDPAYNPNLSLKSENFAPRSDKELAQLVLLPKLPA